MRALLPSLLLSAVLLSSEVPAAGASTIRVPGDQPTIQAGIEAAQAGDVVLVACGTYLEHDIAMKSGVWLRGETGEPGCVTIDARKLGRVIYCDHVENATIEGLVLTGGLRSGYDSDDRGGAIYVAYSSLRIARCVMADNQADGGGGGIFALMCGPVIEDCTFARNSGIDGAGIYLDNASPRLDRCTFHDNESMFWGGGVFCANRSSPLLVNCTIVRNSAHQGGGVWCVNESHARIENCLVAFSAEGEGIYAYDDPGHQSEVAVVCSDVCLNAGDNYGGTLDDQTGLNGNISTDPLFCDIGGADFRLSESSPCLPENNECGVLMGSRGEGCATAGIADRGPDGARAGALRNAPNPFSGRTTILFRLADESAVTLRIYDMSGREVRRLSSDVPLPPGPQEISWDGLDSAGRPVVSGTYLARLTAGSVTETHALTVLR